MYTYNIAHFADMVNFIDNRRNLRLMESVGNFGSRVQKWRQERAYGDEKDWVDANCECPDDSGAEAIDEENIGVDIKPGYFYYDKINWVNHDIVANSEDDNEYNIFPNKDQIYKNGKLVNYSTYTVNL